MRAPLLSFVLVLAVAATTAPLVPAVVCISRYEKPGSNKGDEAAAAAAAPAEEHGGSIKPLSVDGYGPLEKAAKKPKEQTLNVEQATPTAMAADTYDQKPIEEQAEKAAASNVGDELPDQYVQSLVPDDKVKEEAAAAEVKKGKSDESDESAYPKKAKKVKKEKKEKSDDESDKKEKEEKSDYLDESTSSKKEKKKKSDESDKKEKKEKSDDSDIDASSSSKKKEKVKSDDASDEADASLLHKKKKEKKEKSTDSSDKYESGKKEKKDKSDDSDSTTPSPKKEKKEKSIDSDASAYFNKQEKKSGDSDQATLVIKKQKKEKKKKEEKSGGDYFDKETKENPDEDAAPVDVAPDGEYVSPKQAKSGEVAMPVDASTTTTTTTTGQYVPSSKSGGKPWPKGGERQISDPYASSKHQVKSTTTSDAYASPKQPQEEIASSSEPMAMAGGSPDELPPQATKSSSVTPPDPYASPAGNNKLPPKQLSMEAFSGMIRRPIAKFLSPVIKSVCAKTEYPEDCESSIGGLPGAASAAATDSVGVLKLAMEVVRQKAVEAAKAARERMSAPGTDATTKEALGSCTSSYGDIKTALDSVADALRRGDVDTAHTNLDSVETDITTCDDGFQDRGTPSVMTDHDQELQKLASNLLSIGAAIHH